MKRFMQLCEKNLAAVTFKALSVRHKMETLNVTQSELSNYMNIHQSVLSRTLTEGIRVAQLFTGTTDAENFVRRNLDRAIAIAVDAAADRNQPNEETDKNDNEPIGDIGDTTEVSSQNIETSLCSRIWTEEDLINILWNVSTINKHLDNYIEVKIKQAYSFDRNTADKLLDKIELI